MQNLPAGIALDGPPCVGTALRGIPGLRGQRGCSAGPQRVTAGQGTETGKNLWGSCAVKWLLEVLVEADGDFNPSSLGISQFGSSRCCKGREKCRKPSGGAPKIQLLAVAG